MSNLVGPSMLFSQLDHTCDIQLASVVSSANDPYHPGSSTKSITFSTLQTTHTSVPCRFLTNTTLRRMWFEQTTTGQRGFTGNRADTLIGEYSIIFRFSDVPSGVLDFSGTYSPTAIYRIANIKRVSDSSVVDPGPFDIQDIANEGYGDYVVFMALLRAK